MGLVKTEDLEELAQTCLATAKTIKSFLADNGHPQMTYDQNGPSFFPKAPHNVEFARFTLREAAQRLIDLSLGPADVLGFGAYAQLMDFNAFRYVNQYQIAKDVPFNATISYPDLASKTGVDADQLKQMMRQLMIQNVFCEPQHGQIAHTASSKLMVTPGVRGMNQFVTLDSFDNVAHQLKALEKWGHGCQEPTKSAHALACNTDKSMYEYYEEPRAKETRERFQETMKFASGMDALSNRHITEGFDWASLGDATVVDLAGNKGHNSIAIAQANPKIKIVLQDLPKVIEAASDPATCIVPEEIRDRFTFMAHDFYDAQPVQADVYFVRMIMHDYSDEYCVKILKPLVAAMKPGARLLIMDQVLPPVGVVPFSVERFIRAQDAQMMVLTNAKEREMDQWTNLFAKTDARLEVKSVAHPPGSGNALIELVLVEEGTNGSA